MEEIPTNPGNKIEGGKLTKKPSKVSIQPAGIGSLIRNGFPFLPTAGQEQLFQAFESWFAIPDKEKPVFVLKGYAGTGKTAFLGALVKAAALLKLEVHSMAPTGRASKVISQNTRRLAFTIHKKVFRYELDELGFARLRRQKNTHSNAIFVVDEASMVSNQSEFGTRGILEELISYVFEKPGNRLVFIGDSAQLPPVGTDLSPALKPELLENHFQVKVRTFELTDVVRQEAHSGILENATLLREKIRLPETAFQLRFKNQNDVFKMQAGRFLEGIEYAYGKYGIEKTLVLTRTNKQALRYNQSIRKNILYRDEALEAQDMLIVVKNAYGIEGLAKTEFIANGESVKVLRLCKEISDYPLPLAEIELEISENNGERQLQTWIFTSLLHSEAPALSVQELQTFTQVLLEEGMVEKKEGKRGVGGRFNSPKANSLQVKFAYALTCHKSQGGQWDAVFIDHGYFKEGPFEEEVFRWLYTAVTRARKEVFFVQPDARLYTSQQIESE
jgi:exodeoxyribonuclease-5